MVGSSRSKRPKVIELEGLQMQLLPELKREGLQTSTFDAWSASARITKGM